MKKLIVLFALAGCQVPTASESNEQPIINGSLDNGDPAVGFTSYSYGYFTCTATLIGRRTALTAAHCVTDGGTQTFCSSPCADLNQSCASTCTYGTAHRKPGYDGSFGNDLAVINLAQDFTSLSGIVPRRIGSTPSVGQTLYLVGYGCTYNGGPEAVKHSGYNSIEDVGSSLIDYDDTSRAYSCAGDSGGPAFIAGTDCEIGIMVGSSTSWFDTDYELVRNDVQASWIQSASGDPSVLQCGQTVCGDGFCQSPESCSTCPADCGSCDPSNPCSGQPDGTDCGDDCCTGFNKCKGGVCTTGTCCNTTHCCSL